MPLSDDEVVFWWVYTFCAVRPLTGRHRGLSVRLVRWDQFYPEVMAPKPNYTRNMMIEHLLDMGFDKDTAAALSGASKSQVFYVLNPKANTKKLAYNRQFVQDNSGIHAGNCSRWRKSNKEYTREQARRRCKQQKNSSNSIEEKRQIKSIYKLREILSQTTGIKYGVHRETPLTEGVERKPGSLWVLTRAEHLVRHGQVERSLDL